jgi:hypothetical protein
MNGRLMNNCGSILGVGSMDILLLRIWAGIYHDIGSKLDYGVGRECLG